MEKYLPSHVFIVVFIVILTTPIFGQQLWLSGVLKNDKTFVLNHIKPSEHLEVSSGTLLNYNPTFKLDHEYHYKLEDLLYGQCQVFTVLKPNDVSKESLIWSLQSDHSEQILMTDRRIANLQEGRFINFLDQDPFLPKLYTYQYVDKEIHLNQLSIGGVPLNDEIPVTAYTGEIAEIIVFDRLLTKTSKQVVESILGLKYGLKLEPNAVYLSGNKEELWSEDESPFLHRISGLGKLDELNFNQKQSKAGLGFGELSIGLGGVYDSNDKNPHEFKNNQYVLWGDDGRSIDFNKVNGLPFKLDRNWRIKTVNVDVNTTFSLAIENVDETGCFNSKEHIWLALSNSQEDDFDPTNATYYKLDAMGDKLMVNDLRLQKEQCASFIKAPEFWASIAIKQPNCGQKKKGLIKVLPVGGIPPYGIKITSEETIIEDRLDDSIWISPELSPGYYSISIIDHTKKEWNDTFYINHQDIHPPILKGEYVLEEGEKLTLDASINMPSTYTYSWLNQDNQWVDNAQIDIVEEGNYVLKINHENCQNEYRINVKEENNSIEFMNISPNPTNDGYFRLKAILKNPDAYTITLTNSQGQIIERMDYDAKKHIVYTNRVMHPGLYYITLSVQQTSKTLKLIVINNS